MYSLTTYKIPDTKLNSLYEKGASNIPEALCVREGDRHRESAHMCMCTYTGVHMHTSVYVHVWCLRWKPGS